MCLHVLGGELYSRPSHGLKQNKVHVDISQGVESDVNNLKSIKCKKKTCKHDTSYFALNNEE